MGVMGLRHVNAQTEGSWTSQVVGVELVSAYVGERGRYALTGREWPRDGLIGYSDRGGGWMEVQGRGDWGSVDVWTRRPSAEEEE